MHLCKPVLPTAALRLNVHQPHTRAGIRSPVPRQHACCAAEAPKVFSAVLCRHTSCAAAEGQDEGGGPASGGGAKGGLTKGERPTRGVSFAGVVQDDNSLLSAATKVCGGCARTLWRKGEGLGTTKRLR